MQINFVCYSLVELSARHTFVKPISLEVVFKTRKPFLALTCMCAEKKRMLGKDITIMEMVLGGRCVEFPIHSEIPVEGSAIKGQTGHNK